MTASVGDGTRAVLEALPKRFDLPTVAPDVLAPLMRLGASGGSDGDRLRDAVADRLIDLTVRQARRQTDFYAERLESVDDSLIDRSALLRQPVLRREAVEAAGSAITSRYGTYAFSSYTSGTTRGQPLSIDRSLEEQRYLARFLTLRRADSAAGAPTRVALILATWHHGPQLQLPGTTVGLSVFLAGEVGFLQAKALLQRSYRLAGGPARVSVIAGTPNRLMQLTAHLDASGAHDVADGVRVLQTSGRHVTAHARRWLRRFWHDAVLVDRFSMTEIFSSAAQCSACERFHFDDYGHAEVTAVGSDGRRSAARGELLLTGLYPFTQMTPLIRYATGDYAERHGTEQCPTNRVGFRFLGRSVLPLGRDGGRFIGASEVYEAIDGVPDIARIPFPPYPLEAPRSPTPGWTHAAGAMPRFRLTRASDRPRIEIELRYAPVVFPDRLEALRRTVTDALAEHCPVGPAAGEYDIDFVPPADIVDRSRPHRP